MTAALLSPTAKQRFYDANNAPLVGGKLYTYSAGTTTPVATYTDSTAVTQNTNPIILDSRGECNLWLTPGSFYKFVLQDSTGAAIWTVDQVSADNGTLTTLAASGGSALIGFIQAGTGAVAETAQTKMRERVSVKDFGAVGDGTTNDSAAIQSAINAVNTAGGGVVYMPQPTTAYNLGTSGLTVYPNVILQGDDGRYAGSTSRGVRLIYSGIGNAIFGQNILDHQLLNFCLDMTTATGTSCKGIYLNGCWKSSLKNVTVVGMTVAKGYSIYIDTNTGGPTWGGQHNYFEQVECPDGIIHLHGSGGSDGVTTTVLNTIRGYMFQIVSSQVVLLNATAEQWTNTQYGYSFTGSGCKVTMVGCDIENTDAAAVAIFIDSNAEVREIGTIWSGFAGGNSHKFAGTGTMASVRSYGGGLELDYFALAAATAVKMTFAQDANADYLNEYLYPVNTSGGSQSGYRYWTRRISGTVYTDHDFSEHAFVKKTIATSSISAATVWTVPVPNGEGLKLSVHAHGLQTGSNYFSNSRGCNVMNNAGALTITSDTQVTAGDAGAISFTASGANLLVQWTPTSTSASSPNFNMEIRGPWTSYT